MSANETVAGYKGFDAKLACRGHQYEIGKTYVHDGDVKVCESGYHACTMPLDAWNYYAPAGSRFAEVHCAGQIDRSDKQDSKIASSSITISTELQLSALIRRAAAWIADAASGNGSLTFGNCAHAASTGYRAHAASTGYRAHAASTGDCAHAASTGYRAHAASTGYRAHAASTGDCAHAASTGDYAHAASTGYRAHAASTGDGAISASLGRAGRAQAGPTGAIVLASYADDGSILHVRASKVGENGIKAGTWYTLGADGEFAEVEA